MHGDRAQGESGRWIGGVALSAGELGKGVRSMRSAPLRVPMSPATAAALPTPRNAALRCATTAAIACMLKKP